MKTSISVFLFAVISFYFQPATAGSLPLTIATGWGAMTGPVVIAQEKGFFKEQGIKATTLSMTGGQQIFQAYLQGKAGAMCKGAFPFSRF